MLRTELATRLVCAWGIVPAAVDERVVGDGLLNGCTPAGLLLDRGFGGQTWEARQAERGTQVVIAPSRAERRRLKDCATL